MEGQELREAEAVVSDEEIRRGVRSLIAGGNVGALTRGQASALAGMLAAVGHVPDVEALSEAQANELALRLWRSGRVPFMRRALDALILLRQYASDAYGNENLDHGLMGVVSLAEEALDRSEIGSTDHYNDPAYERIQTKSNAVALLDVLLHPEDEQEARDASTDLAQAARRGMETRGEGTPEYRRGSKWRRARRGTIARTREDALEMLGAVFDHPDDEVAEEASSDLAQLTGWVLRELRPWE